MIVTDPLSSALPLREGMIVVNRSQMSAKRLRSFAMECVADELEALNKVMDLIGELDPDVMAGYEVQTASWGYLRARCHVYGQH
jgi:DNA polymerase zeta